MYIDPGTGSMLFTILLGTLTAGSYAFKNQMVKARFYLSGGRGQKDVGEHPDYAIFSDSKRYWNVFEPICDEFESREKQIVYMTASPDDPALDKDYKFVKCEFIGEGNKAYARLNQLKADIVVSTTPSLDVFYWKRSKGVKWYVHIPHASNDLLFYRMFGIDYYDAILTSGDYQERQLRELETLRGLPQKEIQKTGLTYMDAMKERLDKQSKDKKNTKDDVVVLLAPTWGPSSLFNKYGDELIDKLIETGYHIIIRPHPQSYTSEAELIDRLKTKYPETDYLEWNSDNDNFDVLSRTDVVVSDFSGIIFDFSLVFDKPFIYVDTEFDSSPYDACWLDETPWLFSTLKKIGTELTAENLSNVKELIDNSLDNEGLRKAREEARNETWAFKGEAAKRTVDYLLNKHDELDDAANDVKDKENIA